MTLTRQQKRQIERKARAYMASVDADLIARLRAEKRGLTHSEATSWYWQQIEKKAVAEIASTLPKSA